MKLSCRFGFVLSGLSLLLVGTAPLAQDTPAAALNSDLLQAAMKVPASGSIGFGGDRGQMEYRRIRIKETPGGIDGRRR